MHLDLAVPSTRVVSLKHQHNFHPYAQTVLAVPSTRVVSLKQFSSWLHRLMPLLAVPSTRVVSLKLWYNPHDASYQCLQYPQLGRISETVDSES